MRTTSAMFVALVAAAGVASTSEAKPNGKPTGQPPDQNVNVTVVAGKGRIGISVLQIGTDLRTHFGAPSDRGVLIDNVRKDSPGDKAGLQPGDVVTEIDGKSVTAATDLLSAMTDRKKGDTVAVKVIRDHRPADLKITLDDDPGPISVHSRQMWNNGGGNLQPMDPDGMFKDFDLQLGDPMLRNQLDAALRRIEQLERRLNRLEKPKT